MKRIELVVILVAVLLLTGCSNTLKCKIDTNNYTSKVVVKFNNDKPSKYSFRDKMMFSALDPNAEIYYHSKYDEYSTLIAEKFAKARNNSDNITLKINYDFTKNNSAQENKLLVNRNDSKNDAKTKIESLGYKCK